MAVFTMIGTAKKNMQFGIFVFVEAQKINYRGNLQGGKCDGDCIFFETFLSFCEKVPFLFDPAGSFRNIFTPIPSDAFQLIFISQ